MAILAKLALKLFLSLSRCLIIRLITPTKAPMPDRLTSVADVNCMT